MYTPPILCCCREEAEAADAVDGDHDSDSTDEEKLMQAPPDTALEDVHAELEPSGLVLVELAVKQFIFFNQIFSSLPEILESTYFYIASRAQEKAPTSPPTPDSPTLWGIFCVKFNQFSAFF